MVVPSADRIDGQLHDLSQRIAVAISWTSKVCRMMEIWNAFVKCFVWIFDHYSTCSGVQVGLFGYGGVLRNVGYMLGFACARKPCLRGLKGPRSNASCRELHSLNMTRPAIRKMDSIGDNGKENGNY